jgi:hypothetical protein
MPALRQHRARALQASTRRIRRGAHSAVLSPERINMHGPLQTTIDGREVPVLPAQAPQSRPAAPDRLFTAPQTMRGQLALATDQASLVRASLLARPDAPEPRR